MNFPSLLTISSTEKELLKSLTVSEESQKYLFLQLSEIKDFYVEQTKKIDIPANLIPKLIDAVKLEEGNRVQSAIAGIKSGKISLQTLLADDNFYKSLGSMGLSEIIGIALQNEQNLIIPQNVKHLCVLISVRNQFRVKEKEYFENLEKIAYREQIRRLQRQEALLLKQKRILIKARDRQEIDSIKKNLTK